MSEQTQSTAVLLLAHGSPESVQDIPEFLRYVTGGRGLPESVVKEVQHRYSLIGKSPLTEITLKQAAAVERELGVRTYVGMRNWMPFTSKAIADMNAAGVTHAVAICLAPHNSRTSVGLYRKALEGAPFEIDFVESWHDHPLLIKAFAERLQQGFSRASEENGGKMPIIFTAHSVPQRTVNEGDPYECQTVHSAQLVAAEAGFAAADCKFAFQSQGMSGGPWLGPTVEETIVALKAEGHTAVFIQPIGFVCDHVEVLYDIDIAFKHFAEEHGMKLWRAESLNESPTFIKAVADVARQRLALKAGA
ncbi:MAG TPA: ferrochelatase [Terriglobales bacterium]|nr:ferrochelatase [Terriglobales bacterium]